MIRRSLLVTISLLLISCSSDSRQNSKLVDSLSSPSSPTPQTTTLSFEEESALLSELDKKALIHFADKNDLDSSKVKEINILVWADTEYPEARFETSVHDISLAKDRGKVIKKYLREHLKNQKSIQIFNMAQRPSTIEKFIKTSNWAVKQAIEDSGATATRLPDGNISYTKAGKAIVIIEYQDNSTL